MRIGALEVLSGSLPALPSLNPFPLFVVSQKASIMAQAVSAWSRQLGHEVRFGVYGGQADPLALVPPDELDLVFMAGCTPAAPLMYALARVYQRAGAKVVLGGAHASAFPRDALRFFDCVVDQCDPVLLREILSDFPQGQYVTSGRVLAEVPSVEERAPEIESSAFWRGRPQPVSMIPMLSSVGCPYSCDFCVDWATPFRLLPAERLEAELRFISAHYPSDWIGFHDPNFGVRFDDVLSIMEWIPPDSRNRYLMECSLSLLSEERIERMRNTRCSYVAPGIESWEAYSNKSGAGTRATGDSKLTSVVDTFDELHRQIPALQANFMFGLDTDRGEAPFALTQEFLARAPCVWPLLGIPAPYGGNPLFLTLFGEERILPTMPFNFYTSPYLAIRPKQYTPEELYRGYTGLQRFVVSPRQTLRRLRASGAATKAAWSALTFRESARRRVGVSVGRALRTDSHVRDFHDGRRTDLPAFYARRFRDSLGKYSVLSWPDSVPELEPMEASGASIMPLLEREDPGAVAG